jgi:hypothetical protein
MLIHIGVFIYWESESQFRVVLGEPFAHIDGDSYIIDGYKVGNMSYTMAELADAGYTMAGKLNPRPIT